MLNLQNGAIAWNEVSEKEVLLVGGHAIGKATLLFAKIEDVEVQKQLDKLAATKLANEAESKVIETQKETVTFENFTKMDIRIGTIVEAEKMPKTKKLLVLKVDTGIDIRTIVSGIAESFKPEEIIGQKVAVLVNLAPRKLRGVESQGMILMTDTKEGKLTFLQPSTNAVANGTQVS
jgi:methionyl-tRNA synthetase